MERSLSTLQQAYLFGRNTQLPLGGVAMHDFREFRGTLSFSKIKERLFQLVTLYDALRCYIDPQQLTQTISKEVRLNLEEIDWSHIPREIGLNKLEELREEYSHKIHGLVNSPWHIGHIKLAKPKDENEFDTVVFTSFDALIVDGDLLSKILAQLFNDEDQDSPMFYVDPQRSLFIKSEKIHEDSLYWKEKLKEISDYPLLPWKKNLDLIGSSKYQRESVIISSEKCKVLTNIAAKKGLFQNSLLSTIILQILSYWSTRQHFYIGIPVSLPIENEELGNKSTFVIIDYGKETLNFLGHANKLQIDILESLEHLAYSGICLNRHLLTSQQKKIALPVVLTNGLSWQVPNKMSSMQYFSGVTQTPQVALDIRLMKTSGQELVISMDYAQDALSKEVICDMLSAIQQYMHLICTTQRLDHPASQFINYQYNKYNRHEPDFVCSTFLERLGDNLFFNPLAKNALISGDKKISYIELGQQVNTIIYHLRHLGLTEGNIVAICLPRGVEHIMITLACALLKIIWVPLDSNSPPERIKYLIDTCNPNLIISYQHLDFIDTTHPKTLLKQEETKNIYLSRQSLVGLSSSEAPAYYLYTSGTTGRPKCVVLNNRSTSNVIEKTVKKWGICGNDTFISVTPLYHDMSVFDVFVSLSYGAQLIVPTQEEEKDAIIWNQLVKKYNVSIWCSVPAILEMLLACENNNSLSSLRVIAQGGDYIKQLTIQKIQETYPNIRLFSLGGPTETTIWSIWHEINEEDTEVIPYGTPLPGNQYFICNDNLEHCPALVVGRIYTAGVNLALGYLDENGINQRDFMMMKNEQGNLVRAYKTGDNGLYRKDGVIIFSSRVNGYIKIRGARVSIVEIEAALNQFLGLTEGVVVDYKESSNNEELSLAAVYTTENNEEIPISTLRTFLTTFLPCTHIPTRFILVEKIPLSNNGKIDRQRIKTMLNTHNHVVKNEEKLSFKEQTTNKINEIISIYQGIINPSCKNNFDENEEFLSIGLRSHHLKSIALQLNQVFNANLAPSHLVKCKNALQVQDLLSER